MIPGSACLEGRLQPLQALRFLQHHIKAAGRLRGESQQVVACRKHNAPLFDDTDAGCSAAMAAIAPFADLNKHQGAVRCMHDQVNFTAAAPGRSIIALQQPQTGALQKLQCCLFGRVAELFGARPRISCLVVKENH